MRLFEFVWCSLDIQPNKTKAQCYYMSYFHEKFNSVYKSQNFFSFCKEMKVNILQKMGNNDNLRKEYPMRQYGILRIWIDC